MYNMLRNKQQEAADLLKEKSAEKKALEALTDVKKTTLKMVKKAEGLHKDAAALLSDAKTEAEWELIDEGMGELMEKIKGFEKNLKLSEKTLTAAEKLAYAADMAQRSNEIYAASMANKPKNAVKFASAPAAPKPVVKPSASNKPVVPSGIASVEELPPSQRQLLPRHKFLGAPAASKPSVHKQKSIKHLLPSGVASLEELPPSQRPLSPQPKIFGGKSKRRRISSKKQTKRNRRN